MPTTTASPPLAHPIAPVPRPVSGRPAPARTHPVSPPATVAAHLERLADLVVGGVDPSPRLVSEVLAVLIPAASAQVPGLRLDPPGPDAPAVVQHRAMGRLGARTVGRTLVLDAGTAARLEAIWHLGTSSVVRSEPERSSSLSGRFPLIDVA